MTRWIIVCVVHTTTPFVFLLHTLPGIMEQFLGLQCTYVTALSDITAELVVQFMSAVVYGCPVFWHPYVLTTLCPNATTVREEGLRETLWGPWVRCNEGSQNRWYHVLTWISPLLPIHAHIYKLTYAKHIYRLYFMLFIDSIGAGIFRLIKDVFKLTSLA